MSDFNPTLYDNLRRGPSYSIDYNKTALYIEILRFKDQAIIAVMEGIATTKLDDIYLTIVVKNNKIVGIKQSNLLWIDDNFLEFVDKPTKEKISELGYKVLNSIRTKFKYEY